MVQSIFTLIFCWLNDDKNIRLFHSFEKYTYLYSMFEHRHSKRFILSSLCPYSCSLVAFAFRMGGILDPEFLEQCQIIDKQLQNSIDQLKEIPLKYPLELSNDNSEEELFLDIDIPYTKQFFDTCQFEEYNSWLNNQHQWNIISTFNDDLII